MEMEVMEVGKFGIQVGYLQEFPGTGCAPWPRGEGNEGEPGIVLGYFCPYSGFLLFEAGRAPAGDNGNFWQQGMLSRALPG